VQSEAGDASPTPGAAFSVQILHQRKARPKSDGTYIGEFKTADGEALADLVFSPGGDGGTCSRIRFSAKRTLKFVGGHKWRGQALVHEMGPLPASAATDGWNNRIYRPNSLPLFSFDQL